MATRIMIYLTFTSVAANCNAIKDLYTSKSLPEQIWSSVSVDCNESCLLNNAWQTLQGNYDVELDAVQPAASDKTSFQHLKTIDALFAAQAVAHRDFAQGARQLRSILSYQRVDGRIPHLVYGPSIPRDWLWVPNARTFHPGPAFWTANHNVSAIHMPDERESSHADTPASVLAAPPLVADVAWNIFRLAPYETKLGFVSFQNAAIEFLCHVYTPLQKFHRYLLKSRTTEKDRSNLVSETQAGILLSAKHPWETLTPWSSHWRSHLKKIANLADYNQSIVSFQIPEAASKRFRLGSILIDMPEEDVVKEYYEPMLYLASALANGSRAADTEFSVKDVEFNSFALRSLKSHILITKILIDHASVCPASAKISPEMLYSDLVELQNSAQLLGSGLLGATSVNEGLWNVKEKCYNDATNDLVNRSLPSLRNILPSFAQEISSDRKNNLFSHFLAPAGSFNFFCYEYPTPFYPCGSHSLRGTAVTLLHFNYLLQRSFTQNTFEGLAEFIRNRTAQMLCANQQSNDLRNPQAIGFYSTNGSAQPFIDDYAIDSSLAAAMTMNILLPSVAPLPNPDTPPVDHRMLTMIMCIELVVAFGVALGCFMFSVFFVATRPRDKDLAVAENRYQDAGFAPMYDRSAELVNLLGTQSEQHGKTLETSTLSARQYLEDSTVPEEDEQFYGSFGVAGEASSDVSPWKSLKDAVSALSPW